MKIEVHDLAISFQAENAAEHCQLKEIEVQAKAKGHPVYGFDSRYTGGNDYGIGIYLKKPKNVMNKTGNS